jgi:hypothetical protein
LGLKKRGRWQWQWQWQWQWRGQKRLAELPICHFRPSGEIEKFFQETPLEKNSLTVHFLFFFFFFSLFFYFLLLTALEKKMKKSIKEAKKSPTHTLLA